MKQSTTKIQLSKIDYKGFLNLWYDGRIDRHLRLGQAFHQHFKLEKCLQHKEMCDKLYEKNGAAALIFIAENFEFI